MNSNEIEALQAKATDAEEAAEELRSRLKVLGVTKELLNRTFDEGESLSSAQVNELSLGIEQKDAIIRAVCNYAIDYVNSQLRDGYVSHHLTDCASEIMLESLLGDDIFGVLNKL